MGQPRGQTQEGVSSGIAAISYRRQELKYQRQYDTDVIEGAIRRCVSPGFSGCLALYLAPKPEGPRLMYPGSNPIEHTVQVSPR